MPLKNINYNLGCRFRQSRNSSFAKPLTYDTKYFTSCQFLRIRKKTHNNPCELILVEGFVSVSLFSHFFCFPANQCFSAILPASIWSVLHANGTSKGTNTLNGRKIKKKNRKLQEYHWSRVFCSHSKPKRIEFWDLHRKQKSEHKRIIRNAKYIMVIHLQIKYMNKFFPHHIVKYGVAVFKTYSSSKKCTSKKKTNPVSNLNVKQNLAQYIYI